MILDASYVICNIINDGFALKLIFFNFTEGARRSVERVQKDETSK